MIHYTWRVYGIPKAQPRARRGKAGHFYTPETAKAWKEQIRQAVVNEGYPTEPLTGPITVDLLFRMPRPNRHYVRSGLRSDAPKDHIQKPDKDNLEKAVLDTLTDLGVWVDDSQVNDGRVRKRWSAADDAGVTITLSAPH